MMECDSEPRCCLQLLPLQIFCKIAVLGDILLHLLICGFLIKLALLEIIFIPFGVAVLMLAILSALFYIGIVTESDYLMIPMIVSKVITTLIVGVVMLFAWIAFILSLFSLIQFESPIKRLSTSSYLGLQGTAMSTFFTILLFEGFILHSEYKYIKRRADRKITDDDFAPLMNGNKTSKPTHV